MPNNKPKHESNNTQCFCRVDNGFDEPRLPAGAFPPAITWHTGLTPVIPNRVWTVSGATKVSIPLGCTIHSPVTMTVIKEGQGLVLVNSLRFPKHLNDQILSLAEGGEGATVHIVRLGATHGKYDSFWKARLGARAFLWTLKGHKLQDGLLADETLCPGHVPLAATDCVEFSLGAPEAALVLRAEKFAVFCDAVCNICDYSFVSWYARPLILAAGFRSAVHCSSRRWNAWVCEMVGRKRVREEYERVLLYEFDGYVSGHGVAVITGAREKVRGAMMERRLG